MYCSNCGNTIADTAKFCPSCGQTISPSQQSVPQVIYVTTPNVPYQEQSRVIRQEELQTLDNMIAYFSIKQKQYASYEKTYKKVVHYSRGAKKGLIVWGAILSFFGLIGTIAMSSEADGSAFAVACVLLFPSLLMIAGGILMQVANRKNYRNALSEYTHLVNELRSHYNSYPNCPVGYEYSDPEILYILRNILKSGRVNTIQESLNTMIADADQHALQAYLQRIQNSTHLTNALLAAHFFR